jgi:hypothetical protein
MKKQYLLFLFSLIILNGGRVTAQNANDAQDVLTDILFIIDGYNEPAAKASVMQTSAGWFYTAKSLEKFKVNVSIGMSGLAVPNSSKNFNVSESDFINLDIRDDDRASLPTALGGQRRVFFDFIIDGESYEFQTFSGLEIDILPFPYVQSQIGLWKETELTLRYSPQITIDRSSYAVYAAGIIVNSSMKCPLI